MAKPRKAEARTPSARDTRDPETTPVSDSSIPFEDDEDQEIENEARGRYVDREIGSMRTMAVIPRAASSPIGKA